MNESYRATSLCQPTPEIAEREKTSAKAFISAARAYLALAVVMFLWIMGSFANDVFSYERTAWKEVEVPYQHVVRRVDTQVAYTTTYGECYHAGSCGYLHSSSHRTTVYEAICDGYRKCSRCNPREETVYVQTETRYRTEHREVTETVSAAEYVFLGGVGLFYAVYWCATRRAKKTLKWAEKVLKGEDP